MAAPPINVDEINAAFDWGERAMLWYAENFDILLQKYPKQFVAIRDGQVLDADASLNRLFDRLYARGLRGYPEVDVRFVTDWSKTSLFL